MSDYTFKLLDLSSKGINDTSNLLKLVFDKNVIMSPEFLHWEYNLNPVEQAVGFNAYHGDILAAHYVTQPIVSLFHGKKVKGLLSLNTATHPDHRGKKLFTVLADMTYEYAKKQGYQFVVGVANANSTHGFVNKLGFTLIKPLDVKIGVGKFPAPTHDNYEYQRYWDKELLQWRLTNPKLGYETKRLAEHFVVLAPTKKKGIKAIIGYFPISLYHEKMHFKSSVSINPVKIWLGSDHHLIWEKTLYVNFPEKFKPSPLNLIFKDLSNDNLALNADTLKFMSIDFDAY